MPEHDAFKDRGRSLEEEYFRKREQELIERARARARAEETRLRLKAALALDDEGILGTLSDEGLDETVASLIELIPLVKVAWADGGSSAGERREIDAALSELAVTDREKAKALLEGWMTLEPSPALYDAAIAALRTSLAADPAARQTRIGSIVKACERVAAASGGVLGVGARSASERDLIAEIRRQLEQP